MGVRRQTLRPAGGGKDDYTTVSINKVVAGKNEGIRLQIRGAWNNTPTCL